MRTTKINLSSTISFTFFRVFSRISRANFLILILHNLELICKLEEKLYE
jgi:hypothetical protein